MTTIYSSDYVPLPPDWHPPAWIPEAPKLAPIDTAVTRRITESSKRIFLPPDRLSPVFHPIATPLIKAASILTGCYCSALTAIGPTILLNALKVPTPFLSSLAAWQRCLYIGITVLAGRPTFKASKSWLENKLQKEWETSTHFKNLFKPSPLPPVTEEEIKFLLAEARKNPLFEQAWKIISLKQGTIELCFDDQTQFQGEHIFARCTFKPSYQISQGTCTISDPKILIMDNIPLKKIFSGLIFEVANLFQAERFSVVWHNADLGRIDKNQSALLIEYIEKETVNLANQILGYGIQYMNWHPDLNLWKCDADIDFASHWEDCNKKSSASALSHADTYRHQWDQRYLPQKPLHP